MSTLIASRRRNHRKSEWGLTLCVVGLLALLPTAVHTINDCRELAADVLLIVDASNDVGLPTWHLSLDAVTSLISAIDHQGTLLGAPSDVNYGLVTVSNTTNVSIPLGHYDKYELIQSVESTPYHEGESDTIDTSATSRNNLWPPIFNQPGNRPDAPNIVIIVTSAPTSSSASSALLAAAAAARDADFRLYAAAVAALSAADDEFLVSLTGGVSERVLRQGETWSQSAALEDLLTHICRPLVQYSQFGATVSLGPPGPPGPVGATGSSGQRGPVGPQGRPGGIGSTGPIGPIGDDGLPGGSGPPGRPGAEGSRPDGQSGVGGVRGGRGSLGRPGPPGFPGQSSEVVGPRGDRGTVGPPGRIGLPGRLGPPGPTGDHGLVGDRGPTGDRGAEGPTGAVDRPWDRCSPDNNSCHHTCISLGLSYECGCFHGYRLQADNQTCEDVDECLDNNGGCDHFCHNTEGSRTCSCVRGFTLSPDLCSCLDVDECCQQGSALCVNGTRQKCVNTYGSYVCLNVPSGYLLDPVTGALRPSPSLTPSRLDALLVRRGVVVGLLGWVSGLTLLVLLTLLLTWFSDDLLLRILTESQRRQRHLEEKTPREFFLFPKVTSGLGSIERLNRPQHQQHPQGATPTAPGELGAKYIDSAGFLTPHDPRDDPARMTSTPNDPLDPLDPPQVAAGQEALEDGTTQEESTQEGSAQEGSAQDDSAPETPARHESMGDDHHQRTIQPGRSKLAMYPSMEFLPEESDYNRPTLSTEL